VDWTAWLAGDEIASSEWLLEQGALIEKVTDTSTATKTTVWQRGEQKGTTYLVTNRRRHDPDRPVVRPAASSTLTDW